MGAPTIHKTPTKHEISNNAHSYIQSQIDTLKEEIAKTNTYCTEFKDDINKQLERIKVFVKKMKMKFYTKKCFTPKEK